MSSVVDGELPAPKRRRESESGPFQKRDVAIDRSVTILILIEHGGDRVLSTLLEHFFFGDIPSFQTICTCCQEAVGNIGFSELLLRSSFHYFNDRAQACQPVLAMAAKKEARRFWSPIAADGAADLVEEEYDSSSFEHRTWFREALSEVVGRFVDSERQHMKLGDSRSLQSVEHMLESSWAGRTAERKWRKQVKDRVRGECHRAKERQASPSGSPTKLAENFLEACSAAWVDLAAVHRVGGSGPDLFDYNDFDLSGPGSDGRQSMFIDSLICRGERRVRSHYKHREEVEEYDLFSGVHKGCLYQPAVDKHGPYLEQWSIQRNLVAAVVLTGTSEIWAGLWAPRLLAGIEDLPECQLEDADGLAEEKAAVDVFFGKPLPERRNDGESTDTDVAVNEEGAQEQDLPDVGRQATYERKLHVAAMCISGAHTVAVLVGEEVRRHGCSMFEDDADVKAALSEPKPRLYLQWWGLQSQESLEHSIGAEHTRQKNNIVQCGQYITAIDEGHEKKVGELHVLTSKGLRADMDVHSNLLSIGRRTLICALASDEYDDPGGWCSVVHVWDSKAHQELMRFAVACDIMEYEAPCDTITQLSGWADDSDETVRCAFGTKNGRLFAVEVHPRERVRRDEWEFRTELDPAECSDYESGESLCEADYQSYFTCWSPTRQAFGWDRLVELETDPKTMDFVWNFQDAFPARFETVTEADPRAAQIIEDIGCETWAEVPEEFRCDHDKPLMAVVGVHVDKHKLIAGTRTCRFLSRKRLQADSVDINPGEICCWVLTKNWTSSEASMRWKLRPFSGALESFIVSSLFLVMVGTDRPPQAFEAEPTKLLVWTVFPMRCDSMPIDTQRRSPQHRLQYVEASSALMEDEESESALSHDEPDEQDDFLE